MLTAYQDFCAGRAAKHQLRVLQEATILPAARVQRAGQTLINFANNDYLGLSQHPALLAAAQAAIVGAGTGVTASRLISGNHPLYSQIEAALAQGKGQEAALIFSSGYLANLTVLAALADPAVLQRPVTVLADKLAHHSLLQGAALLGATVRRFRHNDLVHLEALLVRDTEAGHATIIVTESVFGMDGDQADLAALSTLAQQYQALLYVDEAHATGLFGKDGYGLTTAHAAPHLIAMGTFGKALGSAGAYIASATVIREYLLQKCGGMIYSTGLPPAVLGSMQAALALLPTLEAERQALQQTAEHVRRALRQQGWDCGHSTTHIIPVLMGSETTALAATAQLQEQGLWVPAIRPPTVPPHGSRLRISLSAAHDAAAIECLLAGFDQLAKHR